MVQAGYLSEIRRNLRPLVAASLGSGVGLLLMSYTTTIFAPHLVRQFGWSRSQFALIGLAMIPTLIALPVIGRLTDRFGVRRSAIVGVLGLPACLFAFSFVDGSFAIFFAISCLLLVLGSFTSPMVYTRLIAADFTLARGLALTIVTITPALFGAIVAPLLTIGIEHWGWQIGYRLLGLGVLLLGLIAVSLVPKCAPTIHERGAQAPQRRDGDFKTILRSKPFWIIFAAMFLCCLPTPLYASQMALMLVDNHLSGRAVALMVSIFGIGTIVGRLICGLALDRFPAPLVAALSMLPPAIGYVLLASPYDDVGVIGAAIFMVGAAVGAEADLQSFLVARHFALRIFSTTLSMVYCAVFVAAVLGSAALSATLKLTDSFAPLLAVMAVAMAAGGSLFLLLPRDGTFAMIEGGDADRD